MCLCAQSLSCAWFFVTTWTVATRLLCPWDFSGKTTGMGCHSLLQGIFSTQDWTRISYTDWQILYHWATWEAPGLTLQFSCSVVSDSLWPHGRTPGFSVHHQLLEPAQTHVHRVDDAIQPSQPRPDPWVSLNQLFILPHNSLPCTYHNFNLYIHFFSFRVLSSIRLNILKKGRNLICIISSILNT